MSTALLRIAVTGGAGQVGRSVVQAALEAGHTVVALDIPQTSPSPPHDRYTFKQVDLLDYEAFKAAVEGCNALVHLAAIFNRHDGHGNVTEIVPPQHDVHNKNVSMSYNALCIAAQLGINRIVLASSVNSIGMVFSKKPHFDYFPVDEKHPFYPEDAYSLSKNFAELQASSFTRVYPSLRIATLRFHWVVPPSPSASLLDPTHLHTHGTGPKDLWGFVSSPGAARACLSALTVGEGKFPLGHETFFVCAGTTCKQASTMDLIRENYGETEVRRELRGNEGLIDCGKAERILGWKEEGFVWKGE